jgi:hypothetical protein
MDISLSTLQKCFLVVLNGMLVGWVLPQSSLHCTSHSRWLSLLLIWFYGAFLEPPLAVLLGLIWLLGTAPCFSVVAVVPAASQEQQASSVESFVSGSGGDEAGRRKKNASKKKRGRRRAEKREQPSRTLDIDKLKQALLNTKELQSMQSMQSIFPNVEVSKENFTSNLMNTLGMKTLDQKREAFQNQIKQINYDIAGLKKHFNERSTAQL